MNVYQASEVAQEWVKNNIQENATNATGVIGIFNGRVLKFNSIAQANKLGMDGFIFSYVYRDGEVTVNPEN